MTYQPLIEYFRNRNVLLLGFGREGRSTCAFIRRYFPDKLLGIADIRDIEVDDANVRLHTGAAYLKAVDEYDLVMQSPGVSLRGIVPASHVEITGQTDLFLRFVPCETVGITGTKGKTTTSTLIYEMLTAAGRPACLIGNMGFPVFDSLDELGKKTAVIEMSSHQLEFVRTSPHIAVLTNIYPEHLDHYNGFEGYARAKTNILRFQNDKDYFVYNADQDYGGIVNFTALKARAVPVSARDAEKSAFLCSLTSINERLRGVHNHHDIFLAAAAARCLGVDEAAIKRGVEHFKGIEHRMEPVGVFRGIKFYNDCIATIPTAVEFAVEALADVGSLIIGGMDRGLDYSGFVAALERSGVDNIICLPDTGHAIGRELLKRHCPNNVVFADDMESAVAHAFELTEAGKSCLLSPAASSYNRYKDFEEKGGHFKRLVREMGGNG